MKEYKRKNKVLYWRLRLSIEFDRLISQDEFAKLVECSRMSINRWESATFKAEPDLESARRIVKNLKRYFPNISIDDVMPPE